MDKMIKTLYNIIADKTVKLGRKVECRVMIVFLEAGFTARFTPAKELEEAGCDMIVFQGDEWFPIQIKSFARGVADNGSTSAEHHLHAGVRNGKVVSCILLPHYDLTFDAKDALNALACDGIYVHPAVDEEEDNVVGLRRDYQYYWNGTPDTDAGPGQQSLAVFEVKELTW